MVSIEPNLYSNKGCIIYDISNYDILYKAFNKDNKSTYPDIDEDERTSVTFMLYNIKKDVNYSKWFDAIGIDMDNNQIICFPIRNNVVDEFVENLLIDHYQSQCVDQWDLYEILIQYCIPMIWKLDIHGYWLPYECVNGKECAQTYSELLMEKLCHTIDTANYIIYDD